MDREMSSNWNTNELFHLGPTKSGPMNTSRAPKRKQRQSVTVRLQVGSSVTARFKCKKGGDICWLQSPMSQQLKAKSWQAENPDEHLVPPRPRKELMKRCSVEELLTFGNLGPFHCRRSQGVLHRQNWSADSEFMERAQMGFCNRTQLVFWIPLLCLSFASYSAL